MTFQHPATAVLEDLFGLLKEERAALARLDRESIERFAERKLELDEQLKLAVNTQPLEDGHRQLLEQIRAAALENQVLLSHARSCVQGVLSLATPHTKPAYEPQHRSGGAPPPLALNMRR